MPIMKYGPDWIFKTWPRFVKHGQLKYNIENNANFILSRYHYYCFVNTMNY